MERDAIWHLLADVQAQIRVFDAKAQVALGIDGLVAGFLGSQVLKLAGNWNSYPPIPSLCAMVLLLLCCAGLLLSFAFALRTVHPRLNLRQPYSRFFFGHFFQRFGRDYESAASNLILADGESVLRELGTQVSVDSAICSIKASRCRIALFATAAALCLYLLALVPLSLCEYENGPPPRQAPKHLPRFVPVRGNQQLRPSIIEPTCSRNTTACCDIFA